MISLRCLIGIHRWKKSKFVALNCIGPSYQCERCHKVINPND
jgi:hypothetical protein